jgi:hypothetical protein
MNLFDDINHVYTMDGIRVPSVTGLLPEQDFHCTPEQLEAARIDGEENHSLIKMFFDTGDTAGEPMLVSLSEFITENASMIGSLVQYEKPLFSERHQYAGKPDAIFEKCIIDFKRSPGDAKRHALQLAGYHTLAIENKIITKNKIWLILVYTGKKFTVKNVYDPQAESIFISLVKKYYIEKGVEQWIAS